MEYTLTFGSPSMSPDPERKKESSSVSCPPFREGASKPFHPSPNISAKRIFYLGNIFLLASSCGDRAQWSQEPRQSRLPGRVGQGTAR